MQREELKAILEKIRSGRYTPEEEAIAKYWLHQLNHKEDSGYSEVQLDQISNEMWTAIKSQEASPVSRKVKLWHRIVAAASIAMVIGTGLWFYIGAELSQQDSTGLVHRNDVAPGKNKASLTLANGRMIPLSDAKTGVVMDDSKITYNDGTMITSSAMSDEKIEIKTPRGGTYQVTLSDGTKVWLNAASSLIYSTFSKAKGKLRMVRLTGEAYFEVAKDKEHPFQVATENQTIEVLGTHFNVNSYATEKESKTSLLEGSVAVSFSGKRYHLKPGEQAVVSSNKIEIKAFDTDMAVAWKNGMFMFNGQDLESIMGQVARWYDVNVEYQHPALKNQTFDGSVSRFQNISQLLEVLESTGSVHFKLEGRRLLVTK